MSFEQFKKDFFKGDDVDEKQAALWYRYHVLKSQQKKMVVDEYSKNTSDPYNDFDQQIQELNDLNESFKQSTQAFSDRYETLKQHMDNES